MNTNSSFDVIIIGGSYAGLSAAMALGRSRRRVLIIDNGKPCNRQTPHAHNVLTHDGDTPASISQKAKEQVLAYSTVQFAKGKVVAASGLSGAFKIETEAGETYTSKKLLLSTGVRDIPMPIDGFAECWGISVLHCPYCHGYEVADKPLGVIANGDAGFEMVRLISNWSADLTLFTNGITTLKPEQVARLDQHKIRIVEKEIAAIEHEAGHLHHLLLKDGSRHPLKALFARGGTEQHSDIAQKLGAELSTEGMYHGLIKVDAFGKTTVPGLWAAGDNSSPMRSLAYAMSAGTVAGGFINHELMLKPFSEAPMPGI